MSVGDIPCSYCGHYMFPTDFGPHKCLGMTFNQPFTIPTFNLQDYIMSQNGDLWRTPAAVFDKLNKIFDFDLDGAANIDNHLTSLWLGEGSCLAQDALVVDWERFGTSIFCNPPYSYIDPWIDKMANAGDKGATVVGLLPSRTDSLWFHTGVDRATVVLFLRGRIAFDTPDGSPGKAPREGSVIMIFGPVSKIQLFKLQTDFDVFTLMTSA